MQIANNIYKAQLNSTRLISLQLIEHICKLLIVQIAHCAKLVHDSSTQIGLCEYGKLITRFIWSVAAAAIAIAMAAKVEVIPRQFAAAR